MEPPARRPLRAHTRSPAAGAAISAGRGAAGARAHVPCPDLTAFAHRSSGFGARANCCVCFTHSITQLYKLSLQLIPVLPVSAPTHTKANRLRNRTLSTAYARARRWRPVRVSAHRSPLSACPDQSQCGQSRSNIGFSLTLAPACEYDEIESRNRHTNQRLRGASVMTGAAAARRCGLSHAL